MADLEHFKNEYFDGADCAFEVLGFYEDILDATTHKFLGYRDVEEPTRPLGSTGFLAFELTVPTVLMRGGKQVLIRASLKRPRKVLGMLQVRCGRVKPKQCPS